MKNHSSLLSILGAALLALGFNTLDCMIWSFYYNGGPTGWLTWHRFQWMWTPTFGLPVWESYFFLGILPLAAGSFILGFFLGKHD